MNVLLQTAEDLIILAGDGRLGARVFPGASDFDLSGELEKQIVRRVRGSHARPIDRGNVRHMAFFRTRRLFGTEAEAEEFVAHAERSFPRMGTVYFVTGAGTRKLLNARVAPPVITVDGSEARLQYRVEGGAFTALEPELVIDGLDGVLKTRLTSDEAGVWFEVGFDSPEILSGNAADGWTDEFGHWRLRLERSENLTSWDHQWQDAPGSPVLSGGIYTYWGRSMVPRVWKFVRVDLTATSTRYGKSITAIRLFDVLIALPNYPYDMPTEAAQLQSDLIALGYTGATVSSSPASLTAVATRYTYSNNAANIENLPVTMSGSNVTMVKTVRGANISLPGYPYAMPSQRAALQSDIVAAGQTGAVVRLYADSWTIFIPDRDTIFGERRFEVTFTPGDSYTQYDLFGGATTNPDDKVEGTSGNLRATTGLAPLQEAGKQFARLGASLGPNHIY